MFDVIIFDADDTLWHNERLYHAVEARFLELMAPYAPNDGVQAVLRDLDIRNIPYFGYGIKAFALSMVEAAAIVSNGTLQGRDIVQILDFAREMLRAPVVLLDHVADVIPQVAQSHTLMLITKGDPLDQEAKLTRSGLAEYFAHVHVVSTKNAGVYAKIFAERGLAAERVLMVGNSLKSDVLPVVELGGHGVHIEYHTTWAHEIVPDHVKAQADFHELDHMGQLPALIETLESRA